MPIYDTGDKTLIEPIGSPSFEAVKPFQSRNENQIEKITKIIITTICIFKTYQFWKNDAFTEKNIPPDDDSFHRGLSLDDNTSSSEKADESARKFTGSNFWWYLTNCLNEVL